MRIKSIRAAKKLKGKKVLVRVDYNLPFKEGKLDFSENLRIKASLPTIKYILEKGASVILISHLGRPKGREKKLSLEPVAKYLAKLLKKKVDFIGDNLELLTRPAPALVKHDKGGPCKLLENIRFYEGEKAGDKEFARKLADMGDVFVNEAFSVSHRNDASVALLPNLLPAYAGFHLEEEIKHLSKVLPKNIKRKNRPYIALVGGAKISTKISLITSLLKSSDNVLLGGALISNILKYQGYRVGNTLTENISEKIIKNIYKRKKLIMPIDIIIGRKNSPKSAKVVKLGKKKTLCSENEGILDIGPETILNFSKYIKKAQTIIWNGPMGYFENLSFAYGTFSLARLVASRGKGRAYAVVGGGETVVVLNKTKMAKHVDWVSTGGGAMLAYLAGEKMPGLRKIIK